MATYIIKKMKDQLEIIENLEENKKFHELEVRFGKNENFFNTNIGEIIFGKVFNKYMKNEDISNEIIVDYIYDNKTKFSFLNNDDYNLKESKFMKKVTYANNFKDIKTDFSFDKYDSEDNKSYKKLEFVLKDKKSQNTKDDFRYSYSLEHNININKEGNIELIHKDSKPYDIIRIKNRYSKNLNKYLRLDMTVVKKLTGKLLKGTGDIEYIIEIEVINIDDKEELFKELKKIMKDIRRIYFSKKNFLFNIKTMNPHTMERKDLVNLKKYKYTVTDKADGERMFLLFFNKEIHLFNPKTGDLYLKFPNNTDLEDTLIDGEFLENTGEFLAFDLLFYKYKDMRDKFLNIRLDTLKKISTQYFSKIIDLTLKMKKFYMEDIFDNAKMLWENKEKMFEYELDGLIFTPIEQVYTNDKQEIPVLKWKEKLSIDVRVEYSNKNNENFTYFHHGTKNFRSKEWGWDYRRQYYLVNDERYYNEFNKDIHYLRWTTTKKNIIKNINDLNIGKIVETRKGNTMFILGLKGTPTFNSYINEKVWNKFDIIEYEFDFKYNQWVAIRKRTFDKEKPNAYKTIESVLESIMNYISLNDLFELKNQNVENIGQLYDLTSDEKKRKNWRKFHVYVKNQLYKEVSNIRNEKDNYHLELACGKGGDLHNLIKNGYKNILAIDSSKEEIYGKNGFQERLEGLGFRENKDKGYFYRNEVKFTLIWGDISKDIKSGISALSDNDKEKLKIFFENTPENWKGFNTISMMFSIHYLFGRMDEKDNIWNKDKTKLEGLLNNIKTLLRYDGVMFGTYLNGLNMDDKDMKFIHNGDLIYKIEHILNKKIPENITYDKYWKEKKINTILISNEVWGDNLKISEPQINSTIIDMVFNKYNMKSIKENITFSQYYKNFQKDKGKKLSKDEEKLSFINNVFMFSYSNIDKQILEINKLLNINIHNKIELLEYLKENIQNNNLDGKIKQLYKIIIN